MNKTESKLEWPSFLEARMAFMVYSPKTGTLGVQYLGDGVSDSQDFLDPHDTAFECSNEMLGHIIDLVGGTGLARLALGNDIIYLNVDQFNYTIIPSDDGSFLFLNALLIVDKDVTLVRQMGISLEQPWSDINIALRELGDAHPNKISIASPGAVGRTWSVDAVDDDATKEAPKSSHKSAQKSKR